MSEQTSIVGPPTAGIREPTAGIGEPTASEAFVSWFRGASPYINAHRQKTFVILFGGEAVADPGFPGLIHDIALLGSLGIRLVLVHGTRPQVAERLKAADETPHYRDGLRITTPAALACAKEAAGTVRTEIESLLSMGVANSPMAGARVMVVSGNFVTARPIGIHDGTDFGHTGRVRRIDANAIHAQLDLGAVVLLSPIGYSPTGESFNLAAHEVARQAALALHADKLLVLGETPGLADPDGHLIREMSQDQARGWVERQPQDSPLGQTVAGMLAALSGGVPRAHILDRHTPGVLLLELFTRDGIGTLIAADPFEETRNARIDDVGGILELIAPLEADSTLVRRSRERLETDIGDFSVMERDGMVVACVACHRYPAERIAELACLAVHPDYARGGRGSALLAQTERELAAAGIKRLFVLTTQTAHWFLERGFKPSTLSDLPVSRQSMYNYRRSARVYIKDV